MLLNDKNIEQKYHYKKGYALRKTIQWRFKLIEQSEGYKCYTGP